MKIWAKRQENPDGLVSYHPLLCHLIDVAEVARAMLDEVISPAVTKWLADGLGVNEAALKSWAIWIAGAHDVGKLNIGFQERVSNQSKTAPHASVSSAILLDWLLDSFDGFDDDVVTRITTVIGGHHGVIPKDGDITSAFRRSGSRDYDGLRPELIRQFTALYSLPTQTLLALDNGRALWLAGFISIVDWIGSNTAFFPLAVGPANHLGADLDLIDYQARSRFAAHRALRELGWLATPSTTAPMDFGQLFPPIPEPNDLQRAAITIADELDGPGLVIVEAPMGEGKTEAALYLADRANVRWGMRGAYVALPTMATSNQMFGRVREFLNHRYRDFVQLQLQHGQASLSEEVQALRRDFESRYLTFIDELDIQADEADADERARVSAVASSWFAGRKQALLAPFGVGTIDQLLLAILPIKHHFVRLFGVANKTIILDEVHAYDAYMTTLIERLLEWLAAMNCHVILLSATLPAEKQTKLLEAYRRGVADEAKPAELHSPVTDAAYPRVSWVSGARAENRAVTASERGRKQLGIRWLDLDAADSDHDLAARLDRALTNGGCAAIICNTVKRAQEVFKALKQSGRFSDDELGLFHAQHLVKHRQRIEAKCIREFGKDSGNRPRRKVLVATQVIEQSLDLDFDLMVTEPAPIDLLLQRSGRLHRHRRDVRPAGLELPELWIIAPPIETGVPRFDQGSQYVYFPAVLLRTWDALRDRVSIDIPGDVPALIASVYDDLPLPSDKSTAFDDEVADSVSAMARKSHFDSRRAELLQIRPPWFSDQLGRIVDRTHADEDDDVNPAVRVATRLGPPTVTVVCHYGPLDAARFEPNGVMFDLTKPNREIAKLCLLHSASISQWEVVNDLLQTSPPAAWKQNSYLRVLRPIRLDDRQENGGGKRFRWSIDVSETLGVQLIKEEGV